jgi:hypothetical protein
MSLHPHLKTKWDPILNVVFSSYLEFETMDEVHEPIYFDNYYLYLQ